MRTIWTFLLFVFGGVLVACAGGAFEDEVASAEITPVNTQPPATLLPTPTIAPIVHTPTPTNTPLPTATATSRAAHLPILGTAPNITNETWLNTDVPLSLEGLRGKVVLVEFWTFG